MGDGTRSDVAAGAATILDHDVLVQAFAQALPDHSRQSVGDTACRKGNDQRDLAGWISLRLGLPRAEDGRRESERSHRQSKPIPTCHEFVPHRMNRSAYAGAIAPEIGVSSCG